MFNGKPFRLIGMSGSLRTGSYSNAVLETLREKFAGIWAWPSLEPASEAEEKMSETVIQKILEELPVP